MEESALLKAALDDLKGEGSHSLSTPTRSRCGLARKLRKATGLPTSTITRFLEIPRGTYYHHAARPSRRAGGGATAPSGPSCDGTACASPRRAFAASCGSWGWHPGGAPDAGGAAMPTRRRLPPREPAPRKGRLPRLHGRPPNELWVTDITEFVGARGEVLPVPAIDRSERFRWTGWIAVCERAGLRRSVSRKGMGCGNARAEGFFGLLKQEFFYSADWTGPRRGLHAGAGTLDALQDCLR